MTPVSMENNSQLERLRKNIFPIYKYELRKFIPLTSIFFMISFIYSTLRSLKDIYVLEHAGAEVIYYLKLFGVTPAILLLTIAYNRLSRVVDKARKFNIVITYFLVFFGLSYLFFIPNLESLQLNSLANRLNESIPSMRNLWESIRYWPLSLFYINAEAWGTMALGVLFWTFVNDITGVEQSKRFYSFLSLGAAVGLIIAGVLLKTCNEHLNLVLGVCIGLIGAILVLYNNFSYNIQKHPELYQIGNEGMLANIYGNQGIFSGILSLILIIFLSTPIMNRGWRFAASVTPVITFIATMIFFSFLYFQDALGSVTSLWGISPLSLAVTFGLINVVFIKAYIPLDEESKVRGKAAVDGVGSRVGKSLGSLLITFWLVPAYGSIHNAEYIIFFLIMIMLGF